MSKTDWEFDPKNIEINEGDWGLGEEYDGLYIPGLSKWTRLPNAQPWDVVVQREVYPEVRMDDNGFLNVPALWIWSLFMDGQEYKGIAESCADAMQEIERQEKLHRRLYPGKATRIDRESLAAKLAGLRMEISLAIGAQEIDGEG